MPKQSFAPRLVLAGGLSVFAGGLHLQADARDAGRQREAAAPPSVAPIGSADCVPSGLVFANTTPVAIADLATVTSTITVSGAGLSLWDLDLRTDITHTNNDDLDITLMPPLGPPIVITTSNGGVFDDVFNGTLWDDQAGATNPPGPVTDTLFASNGVVSPLVPEGALGGYYGRNPNGTWTLTITDDAAIDVGTLHAWSLSVSACPDDLILDQQNTYTNTTALPIPDSGSINSPIAVTGAGTILHRLFLTTDIIHTANGDLNVTLTSPAGTVTTITTRNGGGNDDVFDGTLWADGLSATFVPVTDATFTDNQPVSDLVPEEAMAAFQGEDPNGVWTLSITDAAPFDTGTLTGWTLNVHSGYPFALTNVSPGSGPTAGGTTITLTGTGFSCFDGNCTVTVGGVPAIAVNGVDKTTVTAVTGPHAAGFVDVTVSDGLSTSTLVNAFTYVQIPVNPTTDSDGDGMPDLWEARFSLDPLNPADANGDPDLDGRDSLQEFQDDTHPRGFFRRFFAEGATGAFFDTSFAVANFTAAPTAVLFRFLKSDGTVVSHFQPGFPISLWYRTARPGRRPLISGVPTQGTPLRRVTPCG